MPNGTIPPRRRPGSGASPSGPRRSGGAAAARRPARETGAKLVCTAGPKAGSEFPLAGEEVVVGRASDAQISIPDTSVSRRHLKLTPVGAGWAVADLGSGNGTEVNGAKIEEETPLRNGDVLTLGDTELAFVDSANTTDRRPVPVARPSSARALPARSSSGGAALARRPTSAPRPRGAGSAPVRSRARRPVDPEVLRRKKILKLGGAGLVVVVVALFAVLHHFQTVRQKEAQGMALRQQRHRMQVSEIFQRGIRLVRDGNWVDAMPRFEEVKKVAPNYPSVDEYLQRGKVEVPNEKHVEAAQKALKANQLGVAAKELAQVKDTQLQAYSTAESTLSNALPVRLKDAQDAITKKQFKDAIAISADILVAFPDNRDAKVLNQEATQAQYKIDHPPPPPPPPPKRPWRGVIARYDGGDLTGAVAMANACSARHYRPCRELMKEMRKFASMNRRVDSLSLRQLQQLVKLDAKIADDPKGSKLAGPARTRAAGLYYQRAVSAKLAGRWGAAFDDASEALTMRSDHAAAQAMVRELKSKAKHLYLQAYTTMHTAPDQALQKFQAVAKMTPPGSDLHDKAERRINELQPR